MMQDLVAQMLRQQSSISPRVATISRDITSTTDGLWGLLSDTISESGLQCVFLIIGGIDHVTANSPEPEETRAEVVRHLQAITSNLQVVVKVIITMSMVQSQGTSIEQVSSLIRSRHPRRPQRRLSLDGLESTFPVSLMTQRLADIQERRCRSVAFVELPMLYTPGTMIYTHHDGKLVAFIVAEMSGMEERPFGSFDPIRLRVWSIDHDCKGLCKRYYDFAIEQFVGRRLIANLTCIPSGYLPDEGMKRQGIITRGRLYWSFSHGHHYVDIHSKNLKVSPSPSILCLPKI